MASAIPIGNNPHFLDVAFEMQLQKVTSEVPSQIFISPLLLQHPRKPAMCVLSVSPRGQTNCQWRSPPPDFIYPVQKTLPAADPLTQYY